MPEAIEKLEPLKFPLQGIRLIEASAGTGKTWSIAALFVRLVLGHGRGEGGGVMPPNILVLTFTRAATQELRDRIRNRLTDLAAAFRTSNTSNDDFTRDLLAEYPDSEHAVCARRLQVAAEWMDEAAIHTIHAWCQTMLRQHAFDSGSLFDQEVQQEDAALFQQVVNDYWRRYMYRDHPLAHRLGEIASSPDELAGRLKKLLQHGLELRFNGVPLEGQSPEEVLDEMAGFHQRLADNECRPALEDWSDVGSEVRKLLETALEENHFYASSNKESAHFKERLPGLLDALDAWTPGSAAPGDLALLRTDFLEQVSKQNKTPTHDWFNQVTSALDQAPDEPRNFQVVWPHAVQWVQSRYEAEKRQRNLLDFDDLLTGLDAALSGSNGDRLRERVLKDFPFALIDEFQDTDPVQYRIFERIYLPEKQNPAHGLFMIGDPKQSIYSFRGADIHAYLKARGKTEKSDRFTLPRNFRSTQPMVQAVNRLFETGAGNPSGAFGFASGDDDPVPFHSVDCKGRAERLIIDGQNVDPLTFWYQPPEPGNGSVTKKEHEPLMAELTASRIVDLLNGGRVEDPDTGF
ncbi:UvrD-helicase domain-containing protein, partial [Roseovarius sp.]|uniref:UvrD-helicase domain-containing protein n=1 Tax=Roseovarius sp. TaxID=1486281 RepID=UPI00356866C9